MMRKRQSALLAALLLAAPFSCPAVLRVYEGFDYPYGTNLEDCVNGGTGWSANSWSRSHTDFGAVIVGNRVFGPLQTSGRAAYVTNSYVGWPNDRGYHRRIGSGISSGTMWVSFLWMDNSESPQFTYERAACTIGDNLAGGILVSPGRDAAMWPKRH